MSKITNASIAVRKWLYAEQVVTHYVVRTEHIELGGAYSDIAIDMSRSR